MKLYSQLVRNTEMCSSELPSALLQIFLIAETAVKITEDIEAIGFFNDNSLHNFGLHSSVF